jgi:hypothetical protein
MQVLSISSMISGVKRSSHSQICSIPKNLGLYENICSYTQKLKHKFVIVLNEALHSS